MVRGEERRAAEAEGEACSVSVPLLDSSRRGRSGGAEREDGGATWAQTLSNIVVSIVGTGVLGLPYAFRVAGWAAGSLGVAVAGVATCYCMLLLEWTTLYPIDAIWILYSFISTFIVQSLYFVLPLCRYDGSQVQCRDRLEEEDSEDSIHIQSYGDLGAKAFGTTGRCLTEVLVLFSQTGGAVAYLVFIGQNLSSVFSSTGINHHQISPSIFIFLLLLPLEITLSFIRSLSTLAPFSAFADVCNVLAMAIVIKEDFQLFKTFSKTTRAFNGVLGLPFAAGVSVFCFEGFSMTLALEASMAERGKFRRVLSWAFLGITLAYVCFGIFGYLAYGDETKDIITLNLPNNWSAAAVKIGLCIALAFTFPIMMHPIHDIMEAKLLTSGWFQKLCHNVRAAEMFGLHGIRILMVVLVATLASLIPGFGAFISLVGSTVCGLLSFVLPATFHLSLMASRLKTWQRMLDYVILVIGVVFAGYGTYDAVLGHSTST